MQKIKSSVVFSLVLLLIITTSCNQNRLGGDDFISENIRFADAQYTSLAKATRIEEKKQSKRKGREVLLYPRTKYDKKEQVRYARRGGWTAGFWPGSLWHLETLTGKKKWEKLALRYTKNLAYYQKADTHDLGFVVNNSFGWAYYRNPKEEYKKVLITTSKQLMRRYNNKVKAMVSWRSPHAGNFKFAVIVDSFMNQELLFYTSLLTGDDQYKNLALIHIDTMIGELYRPDYTCYHVIDFDPNTGAIRSKTTAQGYSADSIWARGQSWGFYGLVMFYRYTQDKKYLNLAENVINTLLNHKNMPEDLVPYWDYLYPEIPNTLRDDSAAAIMASALYELSTYSGEKSVYYKEKADKILTSLSTKYRAKKVGDNLNFILTTAVGHFMGNLEKDVPINYADYYFLEALTRKRALEKDGTLKKVLLWHPSPSH